MALQYSSSGNTGQKLQDNFVKPLFTAGAGYLLSSVAYGGKYDIALFGMKMDLAVGAALAMGAGSAIAGTANTWLTSMGSDSYAAPVSAATQIGATAAATALELSLAAPGSLEDLGLMKVVGVAALAEIVGTYAYGYFYTPTVRVQ